MSDKSASVIVPGTEIDRDEALYARVMASLTRLDEPYTLFTLLGVFGFLKIPVEGSTRLWLDGRPNHLILWDASPELATVMAMIMADPALHCWHCTTDLYPMKLFPVPLPVATRLRREDYATPHWFPLAFERRRKGARR